MALLHPPTIKLDSNYIKTELMCWLRYGRRMPIVCTELGGILSWIPDIIAINEGAVIEVEVKIDRFDLRHEFNQKGKLAKHLHYQATPLPNSFYFGVPTPLVEEAIQLVSEHAPKYGVVEVSDARRTYGDNSVVRRKAQRLHDNPPSRCLAMAATQRMSSELVHLHQLQEAFAAQVHDMIMDSKEWILKVAARSVGSLNIEDEDALAHRAAELARCVEDITADQFVKLDEVQRAKWMEAAKRFDQALFETLVPPSIGKWS
jgi:hypothetical protein